MPERQSDVKSLEAGIRAAIRWRELYAHSKRWKKWHDMFINKHGPGIVGVNIVAPVIRTLLSRLVLRRPRLVATATQPQMHLHAKIVERTLNYLIGETDLQTTEERAALATCLYGTGPVVLGYDSEFGFAEEYLDWEHKNLMASRAGMPGAAQMLPDETLSYRGRDGSLLEYDARVKPGMPWAKDVHPSNWLMPWGTRTAKDMPRFYHRVWRPLEAAKKDPKYDSKRSQLKPVSIALKDRDNPEYSLSDSQHFGEIVVLWEVHDLETREVMVWPDGEDFLIRKDSDDLQIEGLPTEAFIFNSDVEAGWGLSDMLNLEDHQKDMNNVATQISKIAKRTVAAWVYDADSFDDEEIEKLGQEGVFPFVKKKGGVPMAEAVREITSQIPEALIVAMGIIRNNARDAVGLSPNQLGEFVPRTHHAATEVAEVSRAVEFSVDLRRQKAMNVIRDIMRKYAQMIFKWWTLPKVIQIAGPDAQWGWIRYTGPEIKGEYNIEIDPESAIPESHEGRKAEAKMIYDALARDPLFNDPNNPAGLKLRRLLLDQFKWIDTATILPEPTPQQLQQAIPIGEATRQFYGAEQQGQMQATPVMQQLAAMGAR